MVGEVGIEPTILAEHDFESCAYTNSATRPYQGLCKIGKDQRTEVLYNEHNAYLKLGTAFIKYGQYQKKAQRAARGTAQSGD